MINIMKMFVFFVLLFFLGADVQAAQTCKPDSVPASTSHFKDNDDGTISDSKTNLMWTKCVDGLSGNLCDNGEILRFTSWGNAMKRVKTLNDSGGSLGYNDWRMPNIKELMSIMEDNCSFPALNLDLFPAQGVWSDKYFWSSTPVIENYNKVWLALYSYGSTFYGARTSQQGTLLRFVRTVSH